MYSTYNNAHRVTIVYSQRRKTDNISDRDNIKTRDPGSKVPNAKIRDQVPASPIGSRILVLGGLLKPGIGWDWLGPSPGF